MEKGVYMKAGRTGVADETMTNDNCVLKFSACSSSPKELCLQSGSKYFTAWESGPVGPAGQRYGTSAPPTPVALRRLVQPRPTRCQLPVVPGCLKMLTCAPTRV
jgi:hypothetical protein